MKKTVVLSLAILLLCTTFFTACGGKTPPDTEPVVTSETSGSQEAASKDETDPTTQQVLKVATLDAAQGVDPWHEAVAAFEAANPGVTVQLIIDKKIEDAIGPSMKSGEYPDVIHLATGREAGLTETFIKDNAIADLSDLLSMKVPGEDVTVGDKIFPGFLDTSLTNPYSDGKTYLAPMFYSPCGLFFNAGLFSEKGWEIPTTWDEMWALGDLAKAEGISLFAYPTTGYFDAFFYALMYEAGGAEFFEKATNYGEGIWETPEAQVCFDLVEKLASYTHPTVPSNANDDTYLKNQQLLLDNQALFLPNGTWVVGEMIDAPRADGFEWGFMALPALNESSARYGYTWFEQAWIPNGAENQELAKEWIAWLYSDEAVGIFNKYDMIQPVTGASDSLEGDMKLFYSVYDTGAKAALGGFATTDPIEGVDVRSAWFDPVNSLVSGDKTKAQWTEGIIIASDKLRGALKN